MSNDLDRVRDESAVRIRLASPQDVLDWSSGEVTRPDTVNYRTHRPEKGGLVGERIFGPEKDYECGCGKYRGIKHRGLNCERCGVKVDHSRVRRKRMGHVELAAPVVHVWFFRGTTSVLSQLLGIKRKAVERVVYFQAHVVLDGGPTGLAAGTVLGDEELSVERGKHGNAFRAAAGAEAVEELLRSTNFEELALELRRQLDELGRRE